MEFVVEAWLGRWSLVKLEVKTIMGGGGQIYFGDQIYTFYKVIYYTILKSSLKAQHIRMRATKQTVDR